jgi:hypothetical protein
MILYLSKECDYTAVMPIKEIISIESAGAKIELLVCYLQTYLHN